MIQLPETNDTRPLKKSAVPAAKWIRGFAGILKMLKINKAYRRAFGIAFLIPVFLSVVLSVLLPLVSDPWEAYGEPEPARPAGIASSLTEGFLNSCLTLSRSDSLCLVVDLADSVARISIRGVPVRECPVVRIRFGRGVARGIQSGAAVHWVSEPFPVKNTRSTISRTILRVRKAPRDTLEAKRTHREPRYPVEKADVYSIMECDRNLVLEIVQSERAGLSGILKRCLIRSGHRLARFRHETPRLFSGRLPRHALWVRIEVSRDDARAIRRALPARTGLAIRLPPPDQTDPE